MFSLVPDSEIRNWVGPFADKNIYYELGCKQTKLIIDLLKILSNHKIVDIGCGCGRIAIHFIDYLKSGQYFGIDNNTDLIQFCIDNIQGKFANFSFREIDVYNLAYADNKKIDPEKYIFDFETKTMDKLICWSVFTHMKLSDCFAYIKEFSRVLKDGGMGIIALNLRNKVIDRAIELGNAKLPIKGYFSEHSRIINPDRPEDCFAHSEDEVFRVLTNAGFVVNKVIYGNWSRTDNEGEFHDIIIIEKKS